MEMKSARAVVVALAVFTFILCISEVNSQDQCTVDCTIQASLGKLIEILLGLLRRGIPDLTNTVRTTIALWLHVAPDDLEAITEDLKITLPDFLKFIECLVAVLIGTVEGCLLDAVLPCISELVNLSVNQLIDLIPPDLCVIN